MKERPILFSGPMVRAILEGRKTQTRRVVKWNNHAGVNLSFSGLSMESRMPGHAELYSRDGDARWQERANAECPYGVPGDRLWVRETWAHFDGGPIRDAAGGVMDVMEDEMVYRASSPRMITWRPSIFMPRWASRITLEITDVRVQRVQEISQEDAEAEGVFAHVAPYSIGKVFRDHRGVKALEYFRSLWDSINAARGHGWDKNDWVWALTFTRVVTEAN